MLSRIRCASTCSDSSERATASTAPPVAASAVVRACHSACPAPAARSCSAAMLSKSTPQFARMPFAGGRKHGGRRVLLVRHGRRLAAGAFADLTHLGLREQNDVARDLPGDAGGERERTGDPCDRRADRVPGKLRLAEIELDG